MLKHSAADMHPENNLLVKWFVRKKKVTNTLHGEKFFVKIDGKRFATPLFLCLISVEVTDLIFAVDSIPAIFAITSDPFIVYTSNFFAILGLRSLYFALEGVVTKFPYLRYGLAVILMFTGLKMLVAEVYKMPVWISLGFIGLTLLISVLVGKQKKGSML
jgi:tellurite resistance protein TerC